MAHEERASAGVEIVPPCELGQARLAVSAPGSRVMAREARWAAPALPAGHRIDRCEVGALEIVANPGAAIRVRLRLHLAEGWTAGPASGECLDAFEIAHPSGAVAAVGLRDPEWLARTHGLTLVEASRLTPEGADATYRCTHAAAILLEIAAASVLRPATPESLSPWLAVDRALTF